ncbi:membrane protein involved in the export of O-antigen and teichoic acid [Bernardetia litoralis DSM 6794]|uniref:Membrane protein involved in the export of O-antigen and teichoic acid n=1 Tax=Bernardetia litoralis (strain ATCC 23117 / DSM 6794 / NBRC 15988 / NCIMB 1366 / Fx l1 / Sio-4) TaxID=880071 RepID=I4ALX3_BERLS|nr:oligosaccharide flippase family protein [Bernardetia litoralis]AFM04958.1 membrane protein involved in the export of O-antigen and teichoic acid [Bernardetia litoralis DSM 6794]
MYKKFLSQTAIYGLTGIIGRLLNYLLTPFYTGIFLPDEYGGISVFYAYAALLNVIYTHGMETTYFRFIAKEKDKNGNDLETKNGKPYNFSLSSVMFTSLILSCLMWIFAEPIATFLEYPNNAQFVKWFAGIIAVDAIVSIPYARLRAEGKAMKFASLRMTVIILTLFLNFFFLYFCKHSAEGTDFLFFQDYAKLIYDPEIGLGYVFLANLIANSSVIPLLWKEFKDFHFTLNWKDFKPMFLYAYPLLFAGIAYSINEVMDRTLLQKWLPDNFYEGKSSMDAVGIYSACYKLSIFITLAVQAFKYGAEPFFFSQASQKNSPKTFATITHFFTIICVLMMLGVSLNVEWIANIFIRNKEYHEGLFIVPILLLANICLGLYYNFSVWFKVSDRTHFGLWISLVGAIITISFNFILIPFLGYFGSAIATFSCYFVMAAMCYLLGRKYQPIPYPILKMILYLGISTTLIFVCLNVEWTGFWQKHLIQNGLLILFLLITILVENRTFKNLKR